MDNNQIIFQSMCNIEDFYQDIKLFLAKIKKELITKYQLNESTKVAYQGGSYSIENPNLWAPNYIGIRMESEEGFVYWVQILIKDYFNNNRPYEKFPLIIAKFKEVHDLKESWWYCKDVFYGDIFNKHIKRINIKGENLVQVSANDYFESGVLYKSELFSWVDNIEERLIDIMCVIESV